MRQTVGQAIVFRGLPSSRAVRRRPTTIVGATPGRGTVQLIRGQSEFLKGLDPTTRTISEPRPARGPTGDDDQPSLPINRPHRAAHILLVRQPFHRHLRKAHQPPKVACQFSEQLHARRRLIAIAAGHAGPRKTSCFPIVAGPPTRRGSQRNLEPARYAQLASDASDQGWRDMGRGL